MFKVRFIFALLATILFNWESMATPVELSDHGKLEQTIFGAIGDQTPKASTPLTPTRARQSVAVKQYPVVTKSMTPSGRHSTVHRSHAGTGNVFFVGTDFYSTSWLRKNHRQLKQLGAQGIAVNVANARSFAQLKMIAKGLPLVAASVDDLARQLNIKHYPILITEPAQ